MTELHRAAIAYAKRGTAVFPLQPRGKEPATANGVKQATTDTAAIDGWWTAGPDLNIGIATGSRSGVWVLDIDGRKTVFAFTMVLNRKASLITVPSGSRFLVKLRRKSVYL